MFVVIVNKWIFLCLQLFCMSLIIFVVYFLCPAIAVAGMMRCNSCGQLLVGMSYWHTVGGVLHNHVANQRKVL